VETIRSVPRDRRQKFIVVGGFGDDLPDLINPGYPDQTIKVFEGDLEVLARKGLVYIDHDRNVNIPPEGFTYYDYRKRQAGEPIANVETAIKVHSDVGNFRKKYLLAYDKWAEAEEKVWSSDSESQQTVIGHLCREAFQEFVTI